MPTIWHIWLRKPCACMSGVDGEASGMGVVQMTATVAVDCGKIPFFTLLGYVASWHHHLIVA